MTEVMTSMEVTDEAIEVTAADDSKVELAKSEIEAELIPEDSAMEDSGAELAKAEVSTAELAELASEVIMAELETSELGSALGALLSDMLGTTVSEAKELSTALEMISLDEATTEEATDEASAVAVLN